MSKVRVQYGTWPGEVIDVVVRYGYEVLCMTDSAMGRELCISRARVGQIRQRIGITLPACPCGRGRLLQAGSTKCSLCSAAGRAKGRLCVGGCGRLTHRNHPSGLCSICGHSDYYKENAKYRDKQRVSMKVMRDAVLGNPDAKPSRDGRRVLVNVIREWPSGSAISVDLVAAEAQRQFPELAFKKLQLLNAVQKALRDGWISVVVSARGTGAARYVRCI